MRKIFTLILIFSFTSCSIEVEFFIYNLTSETITIFYEFEEECEFQCFLSSPEIFDFKRLTKFNEAADSDLKINLENKTVQCKLKKGQALKVATITNYSPRYENKGEIYMKT